MSWGMVAVGAGTAIAGVAGASAQKRSSKEPAYLINAEKSALDKATEISNRQYTPFQGQRVAGLSSNEQQAYDLAGKSQEQSGRLFDEAGNLIHESADMDFQRDMPGYMNPFVDAALDPTIRRLNESYDTNRTRLLNSKAGAFGGDRAAIESSALDKNLKQSIGDVTSTTYMQAAQQAQQAFFQDADRKARAGQALQQLGGDLTKLNSSQIQDLMATGGTMRLLEQAKLDINYDAFREARDWDANNLDPLLKAISATKGGNITTTGNDPGKVGQILGGSIAAVGTYFANRPQTGSIGGGKVIADTPTSMPQNNPIMGTFGPMNA